MSRETVLDRLLNNARERGGQPALCFQRGGRWVTVDWQGYLAQARAFAGALIGDGCAPGTAVAICGDNCPEWFYADVGAMMARCVPAGIYQTCTGEQSAYIVRHCAARVLVVQHKGYWDKLVPFLDQLPALERVVMVRDAGEVDDPRVVDFAAYLERGRAHLPAVDTRVAEVAETDLATLIYTSGTTGHPKGVMLSHRNLAHTARAAAEITGASANEVSVSYLPLSHIAEQVLSIHLPIAVGSGLWIAESMDKVRETLLAARPTLFLAVPRVWEKFRAALEARFASVTGLRARLLRWARDVGLRAGRERLAARALSPQLAAQYALANRLVYTPLRRQLGLDRLRVAATGAAPIGLDVLEFFLAFGIVIHEVYGQSEGTGAATFNRPARGGTRLGSVGLPLPGVEVKLAADGEILVGGPSVFLGYLNDDASTRETIVDGWLCSGDVGEIDGDGFLRITDRKKELLVTSGGKNVAPQGIEKLLRGIDGVAQAVAIGDRRNYVTALLTLDPERAPRLARDRGWPENNADLAQHPAFRAHIEREIERVNTQLARYESVRRFTLLADDFGVESGELTPTLKLKRRVITEKFAREIEAMYPAAAQAGEGQREQA